MQWNTQAWNITTNLKVKVYFNLPAIIAMNALMWKLHVDDSVKGRHNMILGRDILTELWLNLKYSEQVIKADDGPSKGSTIPMVDLGTYVFKDLSAGKFTPEKLFTNSYVKELYESEHVRTVTKQLHVILDSGYGP